MRDHPVIGEQILRQIPGMEQVAKAVRHEHERWDGGGYPDGLAGERIPLASRIVFACDAYHAMVSDRPYRRALGQAAAVAELRENAGSQFDPEVVAALLGVLGDGADGARRHRGRSRSATGARRSSGSRPSSAPRTYSSSARSPATPSRTWPAPAAARAGPGTSRSVRARTRASRRCWRPGARPDLAEPEPVQIVGPYYARSAIIVPCRHDMIVVFGSSTDSLRRRRASARSVAHRRAGRAAGRPGAGGEAARRRARGARRGPRGDHRQREGVEAALSRSPSVAPPRFRASSRPSSSTALLPRGSAGTARLGSGPRRAGTRELLDELTETVRARERPADPGHGRTASGPRAASAPTTGPPRCTRCRSTTSRSSSLAHARPSPRGFTSLCQRVAQSLADGAGLVVRRALAQEQLSRENATLERRASTDPLTGVSNRGGWDESLVRAQVDLARGETALSVALFDLDGLKAINDGHGHLAGDELLCAFATILDATARSHDFVARIGGDEFAVLLRDCDTAGARAWCERVIEEIESSQHHADDLPLQVSWGSRRRPRGRRHRHGDRRGRPGSTGTRRRKSQPPGRGRGAEAWRSGRGRRSYLTPHSSRLGLRVRDWGSYATQIPQASDGGGRLWG